MTAWLILIIVANTLLTIVTVVTVSQHPRDYYAWVIPVQVVFCVWTIACTVGIFMWKKWGFYGFIVGAVATMVANILIKNYQMIFTPFIAVICLFGILNIGKDNRGWPQLE